MIRLETNKIMELIADASDNCSLDKAYSAKKMLQKLLVNSAISLTREQRISINRALEDFKVNN